MSMAQVIGCEDSLLVFEMKKAASIMKAAFLACGAPDTNRTCDPSLRRGKIPRAIAGFQPIIVLFVAPMWQ